MNKIIFIFIMLFYSIPTVVVPSCHAAVNLAKGKSYTVFPVQNYPLSAPSNDKSALTDGTYSVGYFWKQKTTVGWQRTKRIEILIDLEKVSNIGSITFSTARGEKEGGVYYPTQIAAFVGLDREHLMYVGDLVINSENQSGSYQLKRFVLNNVGKRARYVFLDVIPKGLFVFCDEIEVIEGGAGSEPDGTLSVTEAPKFADKIRLTGVKEILNEQAGALNDTSRGEKTAKHSLKINPHVLSSETRNGLEVAESKMFALRSTTLRPQFPNKKLVIQTVKQWEHLTPNIFPAKTGLLDLSFLIPRGGYDFKAFSVTNLSSKSLTFSVFLDNKSTGVELTAYYVPFVKAATMEYIADPLTSAKKNFALQPGESRVVFVAARGVRKGMWNSTLKLKSEYGISLIPIVTQVVNIEVPKKISLNSVNWGYLDFNLIRDRHQAAVNDLMNHHTNVIVVPPNYLPITDSVGTQDFDSLNKYLKASNGASKVLLFVNFGSTQRSSVNGKYPFMGHEWKKWFKTWYESLTKICVKSGIPKSNLYLYPYDEMNDKKIDDFIIFSNWVRKEMPDIRLYATINNMKALKALPYLDVAQIANNDKMLRAIIEPKTELWLYDARGPAKSLSPYSYYRLMAWTAFLNNFKGIGFWAYADSTRTDLDDSDGDGRDYAVIYKGEGGSIISSRRWEAWRMGIEDYELLTMYSKAKGDAAAKMLAKSVLDNPLDTTKADEVRKKILLELSK